MSIDERDPDSLLDTTGTTGEVGSEGGSPGNLERSEQTIGTGGEAEEQWRPSDEHREDIDRGEPSVGRRSP